MWMTAWHTHTQSDRFKTAHPYREGLSRTRNPKDNEQSVPPFAVLHPNEHPIDNCTNACSKLERQSRRPQGGPVGGSTELSHPSNADRPMTSRLAMRSLLSALSISLPCRRR